MNYRSGIVTGVLATLLFLGCPAAIIWLIAVKSPKPESKKPEPPSTVGKILKEDQLNTIVLTPAAVARLGIVTEFVERKPMAQARVYGGEVVIPQGRAVVASAPLSGILRAPLSGMPIPGSAVQKGQTILTLLPLLTPEARTTIASARVDAENQIKNAASQLDAARIAYDRAKRLLTQSAGSQRNVDETQASFDLAQKVQEAAQERRNLLVRIAGEVERGTAEPIPVDAPQPGILRNLTALPGQSVPTGAPLFEVADLSRVWIKTAIYVGDNLQLATDKPAVVSGLAMRPGAAAFPAKLVAAPPSANPLAATVDRYYEIDNAIAKFSPGERLVVSVPLKGEAQWLAAPKSAVIYDIYGNTWVYVAKDAHTFVRERVQVDRVDGDTVALASGPKEGTSVVAVGAAELFGTEVGFSK